jgi:hypothetical protein
MDKEDCIEVLLSTLQQPQWKVSHSVTDWDLKNVLWKAGLLLTPEQVAALFADIKRRGLISGSERRSEGRLVALWGVGITQAGEEWVAQRDRAASHSLPVPRETPTAAEFQPDAESAAPSLPEESGEGQDSPAPSTT